MEGVAAQKEVLDVGVIRQAMAYRVKYRIVAYGQDKRQIPIGALGVHPHNRGGIFPNPDRVKQLCSSILKTGFEDADANHNGVCVQEYPPGSHPGGYKTMLEWNKEQAASRSDLKTCFAATRNIEYGTLSHSHLMMIFRCWLTQAQWGIKQDDLLYDYIDKAGRLDLDAVAVKDEAFTTCAREGLWMELLSWRMMVEEPEAASLISTALNKSQEAALRTSELTAVAVLTGVVTKEMNENVAREVAYSSIKEKLRNQLDSYIDEPEFIELFQTVLELGAGTSSFLTELMAFGSKFVNSKTRQLRLGAFTLINKLPTECPRSKIAILKRAYRKPPLYGYCPSPEATWTRVAPGTT